MANAPQFAATPQIGIGQVSVANPNRDGTGTMVVVMTAASTGSRIDYVEIKALGSTTSGMVRLFLHDGAAARLLTEIEVPVVVAGPTQKTFEKLVELAGGLTVPSGYSLRASTEVSEAFNVFAFGGAL